jgi:1-acyl-sn-glycerol-3-phosphate acyltransferase
MWSKVASWLLRLGGWTAIGQHPTARKAVIIAAPHTSNWDGFWALTYRVCIGLDVKFFVKHSLFWFPLSVLLRGLGALPLDRSKAGSAVQFAIDEFAAREQFYFGLAPEGTRSKRDGWKTGFYRIALGAGVPVYPGILDFGKKQVGIGERIDLTGDEETDLALIREAYAGAEGQHPEKASPIVFP